MMSKYKAIGGWTTGYCPCFFDIGLDDKGHVEFIGLRGRCDLHKHSELSDADLFKTLIVANNGTLIEESPEEKDGI